MKVAAGDVIRGDRLHWDDTDYMVVNSHQKLTRVVVLTTTEETVTYAQSTVLSLSNGDWTRTLEIPTDFQVVISPRKNGRETW